MPDRIGKYEIRGEIGKGGFGKVYRGFDPTVGRLVAIKVLSSGGDPNLLARFRTEATAAGNLNHKNIVTVFEFGEDHGTFYLVMEYLEGRDLQHVMPDANSLKLVDKMNIMSQVAEGLQCAHQHGIVHRDVKPANIMLLSDGTVKIMDFGIARLTHANSARLTQSGYLIGTLSYMAPELLNGREADALCDIWAFGTIYYELLCGQHPFEATDAAAAMYRIMSWEPQRIKSVFPDCPEALDNVIFRLLAKDRESRYQSLEDVLFDTAPILLELESQQAGRLVSQAQELIGQGMLEEAEPLIRSILALDPLHQEGRTLRKELQLALKKRAVHTRVQALCEQSEKFAASQNLAEAIRALDTAVGIDPSNVSLSARLKEMQAAKERFELAQQLLARARGELELNNLTAAFQAASDALDTEPGNSEARSLLGEVRQRMTGREAEKRLREGLSKAKGLIALQSFDEALATIETLLREGSDSVELRELQQRTRQQSEDHKRERGIRSEIDAAKDAIKNRRFDEAVAKLEPLANEASCKGEVAGLLAYASEELALAQRAAAIKSLGKEAWALLKAKDFDAALARVEGGLQTYPDEGMLLKLRQAVLSERAQEERRTRIRQALEESASLDRAGQWEQAVAPLEKALWQYPDDASLSAALDQAKQKHEEQERAARLAAMENDLKQAHRLLDQGQPGSATQLLERLTVSYPGESAVVSLLDRAQAEERRRSALEALCAEIRGSLTGGRPEEALEAIARGRKQFGLDPQLVALELESGRAKARKEGLEQARQAYGARNWALAEKALEAVLAQDGTDPAARSLLEDVRKEHLAEQRTEQREQIRERGRKEANQLLHSNRFDDAVRCLRALCDQFPEDTVLRDELRGAMDAQERRLRREAYAQGRKHADALLVEGNFDAAIAAIEKLLGQFPQDAALREDLKAAGEAKLQQERRSRYNSQRQRAAELVRNRQFEEAIHALEAMRQQFPGDRAIEEDLKAAGEAKLQQERRSRYSSERQRAAELVRNRQFEEAIHALEAMRQQFPGDHAIEEDLKAAGEAKLQQERRSRYSSERQRAAELVRNRQFDEAIHALEAMGRQFPGDPGVEEDLRSAQAAKGLQTERFQVNERVAKLEQYYRQGKPQKVKELAVALLSEIEEPRARELLDWAEETLRRPPSGIQPGVMPVPPPKNRYILWAALIVILLVAVGIVLKFAGGSKVENTATTQPPAGPAIAPTAPSGNPQLTLDPSQVTFEFQNGVVTPASATVAVHVTGTDQKWEAAPSDNWIVVTPGDRSFTIAVNTSGLNPDSYAGAVRVTAGPAQSVVLVKLDVKAPNSSKPAGSSKPVPPVGVTPGTQPSGATPPQPVTPPVRQPVPGAPDGTASPARGPVVTPTPQLPPLVTVDCGSNYSGKKSEDFRWTGDLKPNAYLFLGLKKTVIDGGGAIETYGLPGCPVIIDDLTSGITPDELPSAQNQFQRMRLHNVSGRSIGSVSFHWKMK